MALRKEVVDFVALGPLPEATADEQRIAMHERHLRAITPPVSDEEAAVLIDAFGPDDCYGLAWTLMHLIESAPAGIPLSAEPGASENEWRRRLWARSHR